MSRDTLTPKQDAFVKSYIAGPTKGNATQSAIAAGYSKKTARSQGQRLLTNVDVQERIAEHRKTLSNRFAVTALDLVKKYQEVYVLATENGQLSAANASVKGQADLLGLEAPKKTDINLNGGVQLLLPGEMDRDEWEGEDE